MAKRKNILVIHGPNLNMLGKREPELYGTMTLEDINAGLTEKGKSFGVKVDAFQSNHEGAIIDKIQEAGVVYSGLIINPAAYTHTSVGIRDAILLLKMPVIEIHLSNIYKREPFRHKSMIADVATAQLAGFGPMGYSLALEAMVQMIK
ncbi:MAG: type II 3-dehydroquinate dehydratase [Proteobacteria bacterium]|nr:type II 3-dehydroquinate dehydratase [Pseudomonadota bacterium]MBU4470421.1 type II 3-dehydroquinate dehydratase [Pseudomonadota bacterium]MCG2753474.1 type II 3-dehydroquinate dehydratase [Desulfobacteraceae bacterium]